MLWPLTLFHICTAMIGLLSGFLAMFLRKGSGLHGAAGTVFFVSMVSMSSSGFLIASFMKPNMVNVVASSLTFYLVTTAWWAARHRDGKTGVFDVGALLFIAGVSAVAITSGFEAANSPRGLKDQMPAFLYFMFGALCFLCAVLDVRMLRRGGFVGNSRIARHLFRMCFALLIATFSFYPGQARQFPMWLRETNLLLVPHVLLIGSMLFWTFRMRNRRRAEKARVAASTQSRANVNATPAIVGHGRLASARLD